MWKILIYLIYHDEESYKIVEKYKNYEYVKIIGIKTTKYFESIIFEYLNKNKEEWMSKDYVGILTYSFERKIRCNLEQLYEKICQNLKIGECDLMSFYTWNNMYSHLHGHKNSIDYILMKCWGKIPDYKDIMGFFCNYWMTKPRFMQCYIKFFIDIKNECENNKELIKLMDTNTGYGKLTKLQLQNRIGYPYYPHYCFVMERLPAIYFHNQKLRLVRQHGHLATFNYMH